MVTNTVLDVDAFPDAELGGKACPPGFGSTQLHTAKVFQHIKDGQKASVLSWEELSFSVQSKAGRRNILKTLSGELRPGELTGILGPSGSGKTSLLNILAGRVRKGGKSNAEIGGAVKVNGRTIDPSAHQNLFGYVMQDDALLGTMTPREILRFSALLRLRVPARDKEELVNDLLESLLLTKCADSMVGNALIKGISGGERKRTAVGAELITNPQITFLDEPTSGLDTGAAWTVISLLRQLTSLQQSVLCTIHQPSSEIFDLFDQAIFMAQGEVVYHGPPSGIRPHFDRLGYSCPQDYNPADFIMFLLQTREIENVSKIVTGWRVLGAHRPHVSSADTQDAPWPKQQLASFFVQLPALAKREARNVIRDKGTLAARFGSTIFLSLIYSIVFFRIGSENPDESIFLKRGKYDVQSHIGALTMLSISAMFGAAIPLILTFSSERPVFIREYAGSMYSVVPYFMSKITSEIPLIFLQTLTSFLIAYWMMGLRGDFFVHVFGTMLISMASSSTAFLVGCAVTDAKQATEIAPGLFIPQILFAGFFIKMSFIPVWLRWLQYICALKWGLNITLLNEFNDNPFAQAYLEGNEIKTSDVGLYIGVLLGIFFVFRILAVFVLLRKAKAVYN